MVLSPGTGDDPTLRAKAQAWIESHLADGPRPADWMLEKGPEEVGCGERTFKAAKAAARVESRREGEGWVWYLPEDKRPEQAISLWSKWLS